MTETALAIIDAQAETLAIRRPPAIVLEEARKAATALTDVLKAKPNKVVFNGEQYLEFEDWQTVARFYGITAKVVSTEFVKYGEVSGFSARAVAIRADGFELSAAEAECLNDEEKWRSKAKYEWKTGPHGRERTKIGEEPVPLFQLKSMAQTRACAKVFRQVLAWVVVLAGYRPTPAEELPADHEPQTTRKSAPPVVDGQVVPQTAPSAGPAAPGATTVKSVARKPGKTNNKPWVRCVVTFDDGRAGTTFDVVLADKLEAASKAEPKTPVNPHIEKTDKGFNLVGVLPLEPVVTEPPAPPDEPVDGPEKVLTVRKVTRADQSLYYVLQTSKRVLYTASADVANQAVKARKDGLGVTPTFTVGHWVGVEHPVNVLTALVTEEPKKAEREPGDDDEEMH